MSSLNPQQIRDYFSLISHPALQWEFPREAHVPVPEREAAVLIPLVVRDDGLHVLLTKRTDHLYHHPGQVSFPGGGVEEGDGSPAATALRETFEEIGLAEQHIELIGELPSYHTGTGFAVQPVVGLVHPPFTLTPDDFEVAEIFEMPLTFVLDANNHQQETRFLGGRDRTYWVLPWQHYHIWGATAGMLVGLSRFLHAAHQHASQG